MMQCSSLTIVRGLATAAKTTNLILRSVPRALSFSVLLLSATSAAAPATPGIGMLYWVGGNQLARSTPQGEDYQVLVSELDDPDGLSLDLLGNRVYWTNMGQGPDNQRESGSIQAAQLDGSAIPDGKTYLVAPGRFETGKEIEVDRRSGKLYWADRDGKRIMRSNTDGSSLETVLQAFSDKNGQLIALKSPIGIALDEEQRQVYITDRFLGSILRFGMEMPAGQNAAGRSDVELLVAPRSAEDRPIDIDLDLAGGKMYWTDRGVHQVLRASLDGSDMEVLVDNDKVAIRNPIGISLDLAQQHMYWTDMSTHSVHRATFEGFNIASIISGERILNGVPYGPLGLQYKALEPTTGPSSGGNTVAVLGSNFVAGETFVQLGGASKLPAQVLNENLLTFSAPAGEVGWATLTVTTPSGQANLRRAYRYQQ